MPVVDLTAHPTVTTPYGRWQPLNGPLGVAGFGISAIVCDPGEEFDIEHDETESGQQEAYIVKALQSYKTGERNHPTMRGIARGLTDAARAALDL